MRKILGVLFAVLLLAVPAAAQEEPICTTVPDELTFGDWGGDIPGPHDTKAYLYGGNEAEGRTGYVDLNPWSSNYQAGMDWLIGTVDFLYCEADRPDVPMARIVFDTIANRKCKVLPIGCNFEDCDLSCVGVLPRPIGPFTYRVTWNDDFESYLDINEGWGGEVYFSALKMELNFPRAYFYMGRFDVDDDGNCTFSENRTLYVYKIDLFGDMRLVTPSRPGGGRR
jgi:hypothetical protein